MREYYRRLGGLGGVALILYACVALSVQFFLALYGRLSPALLALAPLAILIVLLAICPLLVPAVRKLSLPRPGQSRPSSKRRGLLWFFLFFAAILGALLLRYWVSYPGVFTADSREQYAQALSGQYNDWHPVLHTLFAFTLPLRLTGGNYDSILIFQIVEFSLALAYMCYTLYRYAGLGWAILALPCIFASEMMRSMLIWPGKDNAVAMGALLLTAWAYRVWCTDGAWLEKPLNLAAFAAVLAATTIFRHNLILFTLPLLVGVLLFASKRARVLVTALFLLLCFLVRVPLYAALDVEQPGERHSELLGLPMTVIGAVVQEHPESLDAEAREFAYAYASQEQWEQLYQTGNFNSIKFALADNAVIEEAGFARVLRVAWSCLRAEPMTALRALFILTGIVYLPSNALGIIGLLLLLLIAAKLDLSAPDGRRRLALCLPLYIHNLGTMLLLTGYTPRFFFFTVPIAPLLCLLLLSDRERIREVITE